MPSTPRSRGRGGLLLLQMLYCIRSERLLMEELDYSVLYRWFVGLSLDDAIWDATTFTKNRERSLSGDVADAFFAEVLAAIKQEGLLSDEHFTDRHAARSDHPMIRRISR
jgi:transposase